MTKPCIGSEHVTKHIKKQFEYELEKGAGTFNALNIAEVVNLPNVWAWLVVKTSSHHKQVQYWRNLSPSNQLKTGINHHQLSM